MNHAVLRCCAALDGVIAAACRWVLYVTTVLLFALLAINVFLRYVSGTSLAAAGEAPELMFPWMVMAGVVLAAQQGSHISIAWFVEKVPPAARRGIGVLNHLILLVGYGVLAWGAWTLLPVVQDERSHVLGVSAAVTYGCMFGGFALLSLSALGALMRALLAPPAGAPSTPH